jgi:hypothetical protein
MIRIRHLTLPPGLSALLRRTADGGLEIFISDALDPHAQRAALRVALRSSRQAGWRAGLLPLPLVLLLAASRSVMRAASRAVRVHAVASATVTSVVVASAAALIVALPHHHAPLSAGGPPSTGQVHALAPGGPTTSPHGSLSPRPAQNTPRARTFPPQTTAPASSPSAVAPSPAQKSATAMPSTSPAPTPSGIASSPPAATATPSPSQPPPDRGQPCLVLLGIWVCL